MAIKLNEGFYFIFWLGTLNGGEKLSQLRKEGLKNGPFLFRDVFVKAEVAVEVLLQVVKNAV